MKRERKRRRLSELICAKLPGACLYQTKGTYSCIAGVVKQPLICKVQGTARVPENQSFSISGGTECCGWRWYEGDHPAKLRGRNVCAN